MEKAIDYINEARKRNEIAICVFMDIKKAFDSVHHGKLLKKLGNLGVETDLLKSYLERRQQRTEMGDHKSGLTNIEVGVPQGSILGPLLFLIYINDMPTATEMKPILFADDTTLILSGKDADNLIDNTNRELKKVGQWFEDNCLTLHPQKTNYMIFNYKTRHKFDGKIELQKTKLERIGKGQKEEGTKFVGIWIDEELSWKLHSDHVKRKVVGNLPFITLNKHILPIATRKILYNALIKPYMEYGITIWGGRHTKQMEKLQKKCIRQVTATKNFIAHTTPMFRDLELMTFEDILHYNRARIGMKRKLGLLAPGLHELLQEKPTTKTTRRPYDLRIPISKDTKDSFLMRTQTPKAWNSLPERVKEITNYLTFKKNYKSLAISRYKEFQCQVSNCKSCLAYRPQF